MKRIIKYSAIALALFLAGSIIGGIVWGGVNVIAAIATEANMKWGDEIMADGTSISIFGIRFGNSGEVKSGTFVPEESIHSLSLETGSAELILQAGERFCVEYENIPEEYVIEVKNGILTVGSGKQNTIFIGWGFKNSNQKITVTVPHDFIAEKVRVDSGSGRTTISDITAKKLQWGGGSGSMTARNLKAEQTVFDTGSGSVKVYGGELGDTRIDSGSGSCTLEEVTASNMAVDSGSGRIKFCGELTGNSVFDTGSGSVNLELYGEESNYNINADLGSGGLYINGHRERDENIRYASAENTLVFDTGSGRVSIEYKTKTVPQVTEIP